MIKKNGAITVIDDVAIKQLVNPTYAEGDGELASVVIEHNMTVVIMETVSKRIRP